MSIEVLQAHYGFTRMPFGRDLAPQMLHRSAGHNEAVARITWCISERALGVVTGEVGSGKTVATRAATAELDQSRHSIIYLGNPAVGARGLYSAIVTALGGIPRFHKASLIPRPPTPSPPKRTNAANVSSWSSTKPTSSPPTSSKNSDYSPTPTWTPTAPSPAFSSVNPPSGDGSSSEPSPHSTNASHCDSRCHP